MKRLRVLVVLMTLFAVTTHRASAGVSQDANNTESLGNSKGDSAWSHAATDDSTWSHAASDDSAWSHADSSGWPLGSSNGSDGSEIGGSSDDAGIDGDGE